MTEPGASEFRSDTKNVLMEASDSSNLHFIIINNGHILMKHFIPLCPCLHPAKRRLDQTEIRAIGRKIYNFLATSGRVLVLAKVIAQWWVGFTWFQSLTRCSPLWIQQLSITMTDWGPGKSFICTRRPSIKSVKSSAVNEPSTILSQITPLRLSAGSTEYL